MSPTNKLLTTISLSILFLILIFSTTVSGNELDLPIDTSWTHTQIQEGTSTGTTCFFGRPVLDSSNNGEVIVIHERRCWEMEDAGVEAFRTTDLLNFISISHEPETLVFQSQQVRYNPHDDEFYACSYQMNNEERWFFFWDSDGTPLHTNNSNQLTIGSTNSPGRLCAMGHVTNQENAYNLLTCRTSLGSPDETHVLKHTGNRASTIIAPSSGTSDQFNPQTTVDNRCVNTSQVIVNQAAHTGSGGTTTWLAVSPNGQVREYACSWQTGGSQCESSSKINHFNSAGGLVRGFAGYDTGNQVITAFTHSSSVPNQETHRHEFYSELMIRSITWGAGSSGTTSLAALEDIVPQYGPNFGQQFGFDHKVERPCIWQRGNIAVLSYMAEHEGNGEVFINVHVSKDGGSTWSAPSKVVSSFGLTTGTPANNDRGNCITYDASMHKVAIGYVVNEATDPSVGGAWVASVDFGVMDVTLEEMGLAINLPTGTTQSGETFFGAPLTPVAESWNLPITAIQWLVGIIMLLVLVAAVAYLGIVAIALAVVVGVGWAFVSGMFPLWFILLVGMLLSLGVGMTLFGGRD